MPFQTLLWETQCKTHYYHFHDCPSGHVLDCFPCPQPSWREFCLRREGCAGAGQLELMKVSHPHLSQLCVQSHHTDILKSAMVGELTLQKLPETFSSFHLCALECWLLNIYQHTIRHRLPIQFQTIPNLGWKRSKFKVQFLLNEYHFCTTVKLKILSCNLRSWERLLPLERLIHKLPVTYELCCLGRKNGLGQQMSYGTGKSINYGQLASRVE